MKRRHRGQKVVIEEDFEEAVVDSKKPKVGLQEVPQSVVLTPPPASLLPTTLPPAVLLPAVTLPSTPVPSKIGILPPPLIPFVSKKAPAVPESIDEENRTIGQELKLGNRLFVLQLAEDFVRDVLLTGLTSATTFDRHLPSTIWEKFTHLPTFAFFQDLAQKHDIDLLQSLHCFYPAFIKELSHLIKAEEGQVLFLTFLFRFCHTLLVKRDVFVKWAPGLGFGLFSRKQLPENKVLRSCWGERVQLTPCETYFVKRQNMQTVKCLFKTPDESYSYFGPLALINFSCRVCYNVVLNDQLKPKNNIYPCVVTGQQFLVCTTSKRVSPDEELLCHYKPLQPLSCISVSHDFLNSL